MKNWPSRRARARSLSVVGTVLMLPVTAGCEVETDEKAKRTTSASVTVAAPSPSTGADPFAFFDSAPPRPAIAGREVVWSHTMVTSLLPGWENVGENTMQRGDRAAFFAMWDTGGAPFDELLFAQHAERLPLRASIARLGETRSVDERNTMRVGVGELTIDGQPATLWFLEAELAWLRPGAAPDERLVWLFAAKRSAAESVRDEGRYLISRSITPYDD